MSYISITHTRHAAFTTVRIICTVFSARHRMENAKIAGVWNNLLSSTSGWKHERDNVIFQTVYFVSDCPINFLQEILTFSVYFPHTHTHTHTHTHNPLIDPALYIIVLNECQEVSTLIRMETIKFIRPENRDPRTNRRYYVGYNLSGKIK
jgi:hypothetical protein